MRSVRGHDKSIERSEEDINKFVEKLNLINPQELINDLEKKAEQEIGENLEFFQKIGQQEELGYFADFDSKLDSFKVIELAKKFFKSIDSNLLEQVIDIVDGRNPDKYVFNICEYEGQKISSCNRIEFAENTFPEEMLEILRQKDLNLYNRTLELGKRRVYIDIEISFRGSIGDLYCLVHELTHSFITGRGPITRIADEIPSRCMERILDDFLLNLSDEELKEYGLNRKKIQKDIIKEKVASFASSIGILKTAIEEIKKTGYNSKGEISPIAEEYLKYILAQIYQSQILKYTPKERKQKVVQLIKCIEKDDFENTNKILEIDWNNKFQRHFYINKTIDDMKKILNERKIKDNEQVDSSFMQR